MLLPIGENNKKTWRPLLSQAQPPETRSPLLFTLYLSKCLLFPPYILMGHQHKGSIVEKPR